MIRNLMLGMSLVTLSTVSAFAATPAATHHAKAKVVAQAPAAEATTPSGDKVEKKPVAKKASKKAVKGDAAAKSDTKSDSKMDSKSETAPAADKAPATK